METVVGGAKPPAVADMVGHWIGKGITLSVDEGGNVAFAKGTENLKKSISGKIARFRKDAIVVKAMWMRFKLSVDLWPVREGGKWIMRIDGVRLEKKEYDVFRTVPDRGGSTGW